jgi:hypothetical protein
MLVPPADGSHSRVLRQNGLKNMLRAITETYTYFSGYSKPCRNLPSGIND